MPMHERRTWVVHPAESAEWLAEKLTGHSWCSCAGWSLGGYLFLNDQAGEDGAFEVAIVKPPAEPGGRWWQVESVTFGWLSSPVVLSQHWRGTNEPVTPQQLALRHIRNTISGHRDPGREGAIAWACEPLRHRDPRAARKLPPVRLT